MSNTAEGRILQILNAWAEYSKFDERKTAFNFLSIDYEFHLKNLNVKPKEGV